MKGLAVSESAVDTSRLVKLSRQLTAALMLLAWFIASGHVAREHGGKGFGAHFAEAVHGGHHHDEEPAPAEDGHHHHDLGAVTVAQIAKFAQQQLLAPVWLPLLDDLAARLTALAREDEKSHAFFDSDTAPPDERAAGWLLVVQTALPVRGPSLI